MNQVLRLLFVFNLYLILSARAAEPCPVPAGKYVGVAHSSIIESGEVMKRDGDDAGVEILPDGTLRSSPEKGRKISIPWAGARWETDGPQGSRLVVSHLMRGPVLTLHFAVYVGKELKASDQFF